MTSTEDGSKSRLKVKDNLPSRERDREPRDKDISSPVRTPVYLTKEPRKLAITMLQEDVCMGKKDEDNTYVLSTDSSIGRQCHTVTQETLDTLVEFHGFRDKSRTTKAALFQKGCRHEACSTGLVSLSNSAMHQSNCNGRLPRGDSR